ncbi:MAG TPA: ATP-binding protein [Cyclobacteriaceae bacterium]|nr:ATP-binding protein [Cyclobacteriaceae bacterium]
MTVIVFGLPGSGKSYFASALAERIKCDYISSDKLRRELFQVRTYTDDEKETVYRVMLEKALEALKNNRDVVVDATFSRKSLREKVFDKIEQGGAVKWIEVRANEQLVKERLKKTRIESEADYNIYLRLKEQWEPMEEEHLVLVSTNENLEMMLTAALHYLSNPDDRN